jgi:N6-adenosine-specific RNA methylase IME4
MTWPFGTLKPLSYDLIVADPPWDFVNYSDKGTKKGADPHYRVMSLEDIRALPVGELARGDCLLLLWATGAMLPECIATAKAWGFTYKTELVWRKLWPSGKPRMGTGYRARSFHEPIVLATMGSPRHKPFPSLFDGVSRQHSRKPEAFFGHIDRCCPGLMQRAELFSREERPGWDSHGLESGKFNSNVNLATGGKSVIASSHDAPLAHPPRPERIASVQGAASGHQGGKPRLAAGADTPLFGGLAP